MTPNPIAPEGPAQDSGQQNTGVSAIPDTIPSAIDTAVEGVQGVNEPLPEAGVVGQTPVAEPSVDLNNTAGGSSKDDLMAQIDAMREDVSTLNTIRQDPEANRMLQDHFAAKTRGTVPQATGDAGTVESEGDDPRFDQLFGALDNLSQEIKQDRAERALTQFADANPIVRDPKVLAGMQSVLRRPECQSLQLKDVLTLAMRSLGIEHKAGGKVPLQPSEVAGAPKVETPDTADAVQQKIDSQDSFEKSLDVALRETAKEQAFNF